MNLSVRPMGLEDIPQVSEIEREAFPPPWPATNFKRELTTNSLTHYLVVCGDGCDDNSLVPELRDTNSDMKFSESRLDIFRSVLRNFFRSYTAGAALKQPILGFAGLWFMADEAHLSNIAVREAYRHRGLGEMLLISSIKCAIEHDASFVTLEVRSSNEAARALYKKYDFIEVGIRQGYYTDNKEDAILMTANDITSDHFKENFLVVSQSYIANL